MFNEAVILRLERFMQDHAGEVLSEIASAQHSKDHSKDMAFASKARPLWSFAEPWRGEPSLASGGPVAAACAEDRLVHGHGSAAADQRDRRLPRFAIHVACKNHEESMNIDRKKACETGEMQRTCMKMAGFQVNASTANATELAHSAQCAGHTAVSISTLTSLYAKTPGFRAALGMHVGVVRPENHLKSS